MIDRTSIVHRYGTRWPAWNWELDADGKRTGRRTKREFVSYPRPHDPKPIIPWPFG